MQHAEHLVHVKPEVSISAEILSKTLLLLFMYDMAEILKKQEPMLCMADFGMPLYTIYLF